MTQSTLGNSFAALNFMMFRQEMQLTKYTLKSCTM